MGLSRGLWPAGARDLGNTSLSGVMSSEQGKEAKSKEKGGLGVGTVGGRAGTGCWVCTSRHTVVTANLA